jgi:hypothetical protein
MEVIFIWLLFAIFSAVIANAKGRSGFGWFIIGALFGPFGLIVGLLPSLRQPRVIEWHEKPASPSNSRPCPYCKEPIRPDAIKCKHCMSSVEPAELTDEEIERQELQKTVNSLQKFK